MDPYSEETRARFIAGMDNLALVLGAALERIQEAKRAALANDAETALAYHAMVMEILQEVVEKSKKDPKPEF
jgi:hypothetical protein